MILLLNNVPTLTVKIDIIDNNERRQFPRNIASELMYILVSDMTNPLRYYATATYWFRLLRHSTTDRLCCYIIVLNNTIYVNTSYVPELCSNVHVCFYCSPRTLQIHSSSVADNMI